MRIILDQMYGRQDCIDLHLTKIKLDLEGSRELEALENGWAIFNDVWYLSRSTRINLESYTKQPKLIVGYTFNFSEERAASLEIKEVYKKFIDYKSFTELYDLDTDIDRTSWLLVRKDQELCAFTKFNMYDGGIESNLSAWDYSEPKKSISKKLIDYEAQVAIAKGYKYLYFGPGCGACCKYKSLIRGFEWWDGMNWSTDKELYNELCDRDESVVTLEDLSKIYAVS